MHIFAVTADYRKHNPRKPVYYVRASSAKEAKAKFKAKITWLDIYGCEQCSPEVESTVIADWKYKLFIS